MNSEVLEKEVLAMYDVRGIQKYIFKTNYLKEVIGGSIIVDDIIIGGIRRYISENVSDEEKSLYMTEWKTDNPKAFLEKDSTVLLQVMFVGGGNAYVLYRNGALCSKVNKFLGKYVLEKTYSLNIAVAVIEKTDSYLQDYKAINAVMIQNKAEMPSSMPSGAFPFVQTDSITGQPISYKNLYALDSEKELCTESYEKRKAAMETAKKNNETLDERILDNLITQKGDNSTLALIHLDGNNLGKRIMRIMKDIEDYPTAICKMRNLSKGIDATFKETFKDMTKWLDEKTPYFPNTNKKYRAIVIAGDDITFICNPKLALDAVRYFLEQLNGKNAAFLKTPEEKEPIFTACAGIAYFQSHFPFSDAYQVAESCCENAKKRAKSKECSLQGVDQLVGNFIDYQMCTNINASNLDVYREKHYKVDGDSFIHRPYYVNVKRDKGLNEKNAKYSIDNLLKKLDVLTMKKSCDDHGGILQAETPRSLAKEIRSIITQGDNEIKKEITFLQSRKYTRFDTLLEEKSVWYDACELMDFKLPKDKGVIR